MTMRASEKFVWLVKKQRVFAWCNGGPARKTGDVKWWVSRPFHLTVVLSCNVRNWLAS